MHTQLARQASTIEPLAGLKPADVVKTCKYIEKGSCFALDGVRSCVMGTINAPLLVSTEELNAGTVTYEMVVERRQGLIAAINGLAEGDTGPCLTCSNLVEKPFKYVDLSCLGGEPLPAGMNIQYYTACNQRCIFCCYAQSDQLIKAQYDILQFFELFRKAGKLRGNNWIDFSGGEPAILKEFDKVLNYLLDHNLGTVVVYSNASLFSQTIYDALKKDRIILTTSLDTGLASTYAKIRRSDTFPKVIRNLIRYRNTGTQRLWLKYVICEENRTEDDLWSFVLTMLALRPSKVMICPDFPYDDRDIPEATVAFAARLWYAIEQLVGVTPVEYTAEFGDPKWIKYHAGLCAALEEVRRKKPFGKAGEVQRLDYPGMVHVVLQRISRVREALWQSSLRTRWIPDGSARKQRVISLYRRTLGRLLAE
jgi:organic radical activating enzyme